MSLNVNCPVCGRWVCVIGRSKIARHNNYNTRAPGKKWPYLVCKGSGTDGAKVAAEARRTNELRQTERDLNEAEHRLNYARAGLEKATAWASKCLDDVMRLRVKLADMQPTESDGTETHAEEFVATLEVQS